MIPSSFYAPLPTPRGAQAANHCVENLPRLLADFCRSSASPQIALHRAFLALEQGQGWWGLSYSVCLPQIDDESPDSGHSVDYITSH